jgi:trans-o-hydroxybenzylidenepyruvate hydratase-aldolase
MLTANDISGMYAIIATPAKPGADRLDATDTVDLDESERLINNLIRDGSTGLIVLGTTGECATLSEADWEAFAACVIETVDHRVPTFVGATAMGGHQTAKRMKFIQERGAEGTLLGLPMWQPATTRMAVDHYAAVSSAFPDLAIMVYANQRAFRFPFAPDFWEAVAKVAPTVTSAKYSKAAGLPDLIEKTGNKINFVPNEMVVHTFYDVAPETTTACWATASGMDPTPAVELMQAIAERNQPAIDLLAKAIGWANEPIAPMVADPDLFAHYNIQMEKTRINAAGYSQCGPVRPPYQDFPEEYAAQAQECGRRWAQLCANYQGGFQFGDHPWEQQGADASLPA